MQSLLLIGLSLANYFLYAGVNIVLARHLSVSEFGDYNVAIAAVSMLTTFATLGLEKLALKTLPAFLEQEDWARSRGFLKFARRRVLQVSIASVIVLAAGILIGQWLREDELNWAGILAAAFAPIVVLFLFDIEVATAYGSQLSVIVIYRILLPIAILVLNLVVAWTLISSSQITAVVCYGLSWCLALLGARCILNRRTPREVRTARHTTEDAKWIWGGLSLMSYSLLLTLQAQAGVIALELLDVDESVVAQYVVAMQIGTFVVVLATSTNRFYLPLMSVLIVRHDQTGIRRLTKRRLYVFLPLAVVFCGAVFLFGKPILALYGDEYVSAYLPTCVIAVGAAFTTLFSVAPYFMQFIEQERVALTMTAVATAASLVLYVLLGDRYGAVGAALAYSLPLCILFAAMSIASEIFGRRIANRPTERVAALIEQLGNSDWVKQGLSYLPEEVDASNARCPFCQKETISEKFIESVRSYFDVTYQQQLDELDQLLRAYRAAVEALPALTSFTDHAFARKRKDSIASKYQLLVDALQSNVREIEQKLKSPKAPAVLSDTSKVIADFNLEIGQINAEVEEYNDRLKNRDSALEALRNEFWQLMRWQYEQTMARFDADRQAVNQQLKGLNAEIGNIDAELAKVKGEIAEAQKQTVNVEQAVTAINAGLLDLGIDDFSVQRHTENLYRVVRAGDSKDAFHSLSEGEKMMISFLYFCELCKGKASAEDTHVQRIAVIDDPISSLSHVFIFNVGQLIRSVFFKSDRFSQVIVLTHSLYFFYELTDPNHERREKTQKLFRILKPSSGSVIQEMKYEEIQNDYQAYWSVVPEEYVVDILDVVHVSSYVWKAAKVFHSHREHQEAFARERLLRILQGDLKSVIAGLRRMASLRGLHGEQRKEIDTVCGYFEAHAGRMKYDEYLAAGYPIATGVIEGACRHLVKDRMERSGMRWTLEGAQAMLNLRALRQSNVSLFCLALAAFGISYGSQRYLEHRGDPPNDSDVGAGSHPDPDEFSAPDGMVWIPGGEFVMGTSDEDAWRDEKPAHRVRVDGFWIDKTEVTNAQFRKFVEATGYVTTAERTPDWDEIKKQLPPGTPAPPAEKIVPASIVFTMTETAVPLNDISQWWKWTPGANWRHPEGPGSDLTGRENHPVVQVSWDDAVAYCEWAGKRLPTEAEWEFAARGGLVGKRFTWGSQRDQCRKHANIWEGRFPFRNTKADGYVGTAPVGSFQPNGYGLHDMAGNVWEWCADWYRRDLYRLRRDQLVINPAGPGESYDPTRPHQSQRVQRGGSFLCNDAYCSRYRPSARHGCTPDTGMSHVGFRCVMTREAGERKDKRSKHN
eukprot:g10469.t1